MSLSKGHLPQMRRGNQIRDRNYSVAIGGGLVRAFLGKLKITMPAKRSNPKIMGRAGELRKELTPAIELDDERIMA